MYDYVRGLSAAPVSDGDLECDLEVYTMEGGIGMFCTTLRWSVQSEAGIAAMFEA